MCSNGIFGHHDHHCNHNLHVVITSMKTVAVTAHLGSSSSCDILLHITYITAYMRVQQLQLEFAAEGDVGALDIDELALTIGLRSYTHMII